MYISHKLPLQTNQFSKDYMESLAIIIHQRQTYLRGLPYKGPSGVPVILHFPFPLSPTLSNLLEKQDHVQNFIALNEGEKGKGICSWQRSNKICFSVAVSQQFCNW